MVVESGYPEVDSNPSFPKLEDDVLKFWGKTAAFQQSISNRQALSENAKNNEFIFYDGPPFANGLPHYGHLLTGYVKDLVARYQTQAGKKVERRFGWDCHGLPAEMGAEKELGISGRQSIIEYGIDKFNAHCQTSVMKYTKEWQDYVNRQGRWVDFENDYKTMDITYMESVLWAFKQLHQKGLIYQSMRVMPYSWACETPLSNFETRLDNSYRERTDKAITVGFSLTTLPKALQGKIVKARLLAWTTTPWTLPSNLALGVGPRLRYVAVIGKDKTASILVASSIKKYEKELGISDDIETIELHGSDLVGLSYTPMFDYFKDTPHAFKVLAAEFVEEGDGTGVVHLAPGFGEDDLHVCEQHLIEIVCPVDNAGKFDSRVPDYQGMLVFDANDEIIKRLKAEGKWLKTEQVIHNYPHCWRTDTPLIYKAVPSWYVEVTKFKDRMVGLNQEINWVPGHVKDGLFGKWLENARDWSISRNRFFGTPIPVWMSDDPKYPRIEVYGSIKELQEAFGVEVTDLHRPFIDSLVRKNPDDPTGKSNMRRVEDVFDCWFESGSMPFAQVHYPFENHAWFDAHFPADFIVEYTAQTRGWFYTLMILGTALFDKPPFKNCICHGVVLDEKGQKLSKRLNNYADPKELFAIYGSDALRFLMVSSPVMLGGELLIDKEGQMVRDVLRLSIKPIWNAYNFFTLYANADGLEGHLQANSDHLLDRYILSKAKSCILKMQIGFENYNIPFVTSQIDQFFEVLNNWYIRRSRSRFWKTERDADKQSAYDTLYTVLHVMSRAIAPVLPFVSEVMWIGLTSKLSVADAVDQPCISVHLSDFPDPKDLPYDEQLVADMDRVRDVCNAALGIRNQQQIRVRQPLASLKIMGNHVLGLEDYSDIIMDEVNVKDISFSSEIGDAASLKLKINFPVLGKRLPQKMKEIIAASKQEAIERNVGGKVVLAGEALRDEECSLLLEPKDQGSTAALSTQDALIVLDLEITSQLRLEGIARDVIRLVQQSRKDAGLHISDRIVLRLESPHHDVKQAVDECKETIAEQTLAISVDSGDAKQSTHRFEQEIDGQAIIIGLDLAA